MIFTWGVTGCPLPLGVTMRDAEPQEIQSDRAVWEKACKRDFERNPREEGDGDCCTVLRLFSSLVQYVAAHENSMLSAEKNALDPSLGGETGEGTQQV